MSVSRMTPQEQVNYLVARVDQLEAELQVTSSVMLGLSIVIVAFVAISLYKVTHK